jgi:hypothetical protein
MCSFRCKALPGAIVPEYAKCFVFEDFDIFALCYEDVAKTGKLSYENKRFTGWYPRGRVPEDS